MAFYNTSQFRFALFPSSLAIDLCDIHLSIKKGPLGLSGPIVDQELRNDYLSNINFPYLAP